jgi:predicted Zn-dependent protease
MGKPEKRSGKPTRKAKAALLAVLIGAGLYGGYLLATLGLFWPGAAGTVDGFVNPALLKVRIVPLVPSAQVLAQLPERSRDLRAKSEALLEPEQLDKLSQGLAKQFPFTYVVAKARPIPDEFYDARRGQYRIDQILHWMVKESAACDFKTIAVLAQDVYAPGYNYLFGQSTVGGTACVSSSRRMVSPGLKKPERRWRELVTHEFGHALGLQHNPNNMSIMAYANSLPEMDLQGARMLGNDWTMLRQLYPVRWR